jgi:thymidylate kinase
MKNEVKYERDYIQYLIEKQKSIDTVLLDRYFLNEIEFQELINTVELDDILSFQSFVKSKKIDSLLG